MKIVFSSPRKVQQFATVFANLKTFTDNVCIYFRPTGVYIQCMDDSHCCLFECELHADWFETYEFDDSTDQPCVGINIAILNKVLSTWHDSQTFTIKLEAGQDKLSINFEKSNSFSEECELSPNKIECEFILFFISRYSLYSYSGLWSESLIKRSTWSVIVLSV